MSVGSNLQEMENVVTKGAAAAEPMPKLDLDTPGQPSVEDLGGPSPENYRPDDDSAKLNEPGSTLAQVKNVVNKGAKSADPMPKGMKEEEAEVEVEEDQEIVSEAEATEEEVVSEEETSEEEVVAEATDEEEISAEYSIEEDVNA